MTSDSDCRFGANFFFVFFLLVFLTIAYFTVFCIGSVAGAGIDYFFTKMETKSVGDRARLSCFSLSICCASFNL